MDNKKIPGLRFAARLTAIIQSSSVTESCSHTPGSPFYNDVCNYNIIDVRMGQQDWTDLLV